MRHYFKSTFPRPSRNQGRSRATWQAGILLSRQLHSGSLLCWEGLASTRQTLPLRRRHYSPVPWPTPGWLPASRHPQPLGSSGQCTPMGAGKQHPALARRCPGGSSRMQAERRQSFAWDKQLQRTDTARTRHTRETLPLFASAQGLQCSVRAQGRSR